MGRGVSEARKKAEAHIKRKPDVKPADLAKKYSINLTTAYRAIAKVKSAGKGQS